MIVGKGAPIGGQVITKKKGSWRTEIKRRSFKIITLSHGL